jgi:signal transduction histidine kinase
MRHDNIRIDVEKPEELPKVRCRSQQIQQVLMNLITNARDALNERYPKYDEDKVLRIALSSIERDGQVWVRTTVEDHGTGIAPEVRDRMFDPFYTTKGRDKGTGLGLAISHGIVMDHEGVLLVESEPGSYTRFHIDLPVLLD